MSGELPLDGVRTLGWRLRRHALAPVTGGSVADVVRRVVALRGWPADLADLTICVRQQTPEPGGLDRALETGELIRSYAFRGGSYVFAPETGADLLAARTASRVWETRRFQQQGGFALDDWEPLRETIRDALAAGPLTRAELAAHLAATPGLTHLVDAASGAGSDSLYKPLHWWGDICFGPARDGQATFRLLADDPRWPGPPDVDDAGRRAITAYLAAYGPVTTANLGYWLTEGLSVPRRRLLGWLADLSDTVAAVNVDGVDAYALTADLDELSAAEPADGVRLLPGFDPWIMGPGTADTRLIAAERRAVATRGANLVTQAGIVAGTWRIRRRELSVSWFAEAGPAPASDLEEETRRLAGIRGSDLDLTIEVA